MVVSTHDLAPALLLPCLPHFLVPQREFPVDYAARLSHISDLLACVKAFEQEAVDVDASGVTASDRLGHLLQHVSLLSDVDTKHNVPKATTPGSAKLQEAQPAKLSAVVLSTVHAAKGMEWDVVFVVGAEASLFPHSRSVVADSDKDALPGKESPLDEVACSCACYCR